MQNYEYKEQKMLPNTNQFTLTLTQLMSPLCQGKLSEIDYKGKCSPNPP